MAPVLSDCAQQSVLLVVDLARLNFTLCVLTVGWQRKDRINVNTS